MEKVYCTPITVIGLFGSARFRNEFLKLEKHLTFKDCLILLPYFDGLEHKESYSEEEWEYLMNQAFKRIDLSDIIFIVNKDNYIGTHTQMEIDYAIEYEKPIIFLENFNPIKEDPKKFRKYYCPKENLWIQICYDDCEFSEAYTGCTHSISKLRKQLLKGYQSD
jgi:hypothetical protein